MTCNNCGHPDIDHVTGSRPDGRTMGECRRCGCPVVIGEPELGIVGPWAVCKLCGRRVCGANDPDLLVKFAAHDCGR